MKMRVFLMVGIIAILISTATAIPGIATFYTQYVPSACYGNQSQGVMVAAASDTFWNGGAACGKYYNVMCTRDHNVTVKIVDHCPDCSSTIDDLSREAFAKIAKPMAGIVINIDYHQVEVTQRLE